MTDNSDQRSSYNYFADITTRWMDNDIYGHVNNVVYYSYFDSVANQFLIEEGGLDIHSAEIIGFVVASNCQYKLPIRIKSMPACGSISWVIAQWNTVSRFLNRAPKLLQQSAPLPMCLSIAPLTSQWRFPLKLDLL